MSFFQGLKQYPKALKSVFWFNSPTSQVNTDEKAWLTIPGMQKGFLDPSSISSQGGYSKLSYEWLGEGSDGGTSNRLEALQVDEMGFPADDEVFQVDEIFLQNAH